MRKQNSIKNIITSIIPYIIITFLGFLRLKVMLNSLGEEIYALNQVFIQIFSYISLLEAGVGTLITQMYYKYFVKNDKNKICQIFSYSKKLLNKISVIMLVCGVAVSFGLKILTNNDLSLYYMQFVFILYLFKSVLEYLMYAPRFVIAADQKSYKINLSSNIFKILEMLLEVVLLSLYKNYIVILLATIVIRYITYFVSNRIVYKEYPWLKQTNTSEKLNFKEMKAVIAHKLAGTVYSNTDILLASMFLKPIQVVIYSSYNYIIKFISDIMYMIGSAITASMGNVLYKDKKENQYFIFEKINSVFVFLAMLMSITLFLSTGKFVELWIGADKLLSTITFFLMILTLFINIYIRPLLIVRDSKALYSETKLIPIFEAVINIVLSFVLVQRFELFGLLLATVIASSLTTLIFYPIYIYKKFYNQDVSKYFLKMFGCFGATILLCYVLNKYNFILSANNYIIWFIYSVLYFLIVSIIVFAFNIIISKNFRQTIKELIDQVLRR